MREFLKRFILFLLFAKTFVVSLYSAVPEGSLIKTKSGLVSIEHLKEGDAVIGLDSDFKSVNTSIKKICRTDRHYIYNIHLKKGVFATSEDQLFYDPILKCWIMAESLTSKNSLVDSDLNVLRCEKVIKEEKEAIFYELTLDNPHVFFVSDLEVLSHNFIPFISIGLVFGGGEVALASITAGVGFLGYMIGVKAFGKDKKYFDSQYDFDKNQNFFFDAKLPGKPDAKDGYTPPKKWDGKKVKAPGDRGYGWPDKDGNVWVPTGLGPSAHGGPHWDVQSKDGKTYENVYPGGRIR